MTQPEVLVSIADGQHFRPQLWVGVIVDGVDTEDYSRAYCDGKGCGAAKVRARVIAALPDGGVLCWCFHHGNRFRAVLEEQGALLVPLAVDD